MKELRDIKLDLLFGNDNEIINLFNEITDGIEIVNTNVYNEEGLEFIYHKDGQWIFYQDSKNERFWVNYYKYWSIFESKFSLNYEEIQAITRVLVEEALKREVSTPKFEIHASGLGVEEALKREVSTPRVNSRNSYCWVEEALKREVSTPKSSVININGVVEEALKRELEVIRIH